MIRHWWKTLFSARRKARTLRRRPRGWPAPRPLLGVESLEDRTTPAVTASLAVTTLQVNLSAAGDEARIGVTGANIEVRDGTNALIFATPAAGVTDFAITGVSAGNQTVVWNNAVTLTGGATVNAVTTLTVNGTYTLGGNLAVTLAGPGAGSVNDGTTGVLTVAGTTAFDAGTGRSVVLDNATGHDFSTVSVTSALDVTLHDNNALVLGASTVTGALTATTNGPLTQTGVVIVAGATTLTVGAANDITLNTVGNNFTTVTINSGHNVTLRDADAIALGTSTVSGTLAMTAGGAITQTGAVIVTGAATFAAGVGNDINLGTAANDFSTVSILSGRNVALLDANAIDLGGSTVSGTLSVTANGPITQSGTLTVVGAAAFAAGAGNDVTLNAANDFQSAVGVTSARNVALNDVNALILGTSNVAGNFAVTANGPITQTGPLVIAGAATFAAGAANDITLADPGNNFNSVAATGRNITLHDANGIVLAAPTAAVTLSVIANGPISQTGTLTVTGAATFDAGAANDITLANAGNDFGTVNVGSGQNVAITDANGLTLGTLTVSGTLAVTAGGPVNQSGPAVVVGTATFTVGAANDLTLDNPGNDFQSAVTASARNVTIVDANSLTLGTITAAGTVVLTAATGAIIDGNGNALNVSALALRMNAATGIGSGDAIETAVTTLAAADTVSGNIEATNTGALIVGTVAGLPGVTRSGAIPGNIILTAASPLTINAAVTDASGGDITLTAVNDGGNDDHLTINAQVLATGGNGNITLNAGTDLIVNDSGATPDIATVGAGTITANVVRNTILGANVTIATAGGAITFTTNDIDINAAAAVNATAAGRVTIQPTTAGQTIDLGTNAGLGLTNGELGRITAAVLTVGRNDATAAGAITVSAPVALTTVTTLSLRTGAGVNQTGGPLTVTELAVRANGAVNLGAAANDATRLAITTGTGNVSYRDANGFEISSVDGVNGLTTPGNVTLRNDTAAAVTQTQIITAAGLELLGAGPYQLDSLANSITTLAANTTEAVAVRDAGGLTVGTVNGTAGITTTNDRVTLCSDAGPLILAANITTGTETVRLVSGNGITQTAGTITAAALGARTTAGDISLGAGPNAVPVLAIASAGGFTYNAAGPFAFGTVTAADCFTTPVTGLTIGAAGDLTLCQATGTLTVNAPVTTTGTVRLAALNGDITQTAAIIAGNLGAFAGGAGHSVLLNTVANDVTGQFAAAATTNVRYRDANGFTVGLVPVATCFPGADGISAAADVTLQTDAAGTVSQTRRIFAFGLELLGAATYALDTLTGAAANAVVVLAANTTDAISYADADGLFIATVGGTTGITTTGGAVTVCADVDPGAPAGPLTLVTNVTIGGGTLRLQSANGINQVAGTITAGALGARTTAGDISLGIGPNAVPVLAINSAGSFLYNAAGPFAFGTVTASGCFTQTVTGLTVGAAGDVTLCQATGTLTVNVPVTTTGTVRLFAANGDVTQTAAITAGNLGAVAGGAGHSVLLDTAANNVTGQLAATAAANVRYSDVNGFTVGLVPLATCFPGADGVQSTAAGDIVLTDTAAVAPDAGITVNRPVTAANGNITLTADALAINTTISAGTTGCVTLQPFSAAQAVDVGGADAAGTLGLTNTELNQVTARVLRVGRNDAGFTGGLTVTAPITLSTAAAPPAVGTNTLVLRAGGAVTEAAGGTLTVRNLGVLTGNATAAGSAALNNANAVTTLAANVAAPAATNSGAFSFTNAQSLTAGAVFTCDTAAFPPDGFVRGISTVNGAITVTLTAAGAVLTVDEPITAGAAPASATTGDVTLTADNMAINAAVRGRCVTLQQLSAAQAIDLGGADAAGTLGLTNAELNRVNAVALRVGRNDAGFTGAITITAGIALSTLTAPPATDTLALRAGGDVTEAVGGTLAVANVAVQSGGAVTLGNANTIGRVAVNAGATRDIIVTDGAGVTLTIGPVDVCGTIVTDVTTPAGNGNVTITADDLDILAQVRGTCVILQPFSTNRDVDVGTDGSAANPALGLTDAELDRVTATTALRVGRNDAGFTGNLRVSAPITQAGSGYTSLELRAGGDITETTGTLTVTNLAVQAGRTVNLTNANGVTNLAGRSGLNAPPSATDRVFRFINSPTLTVDTVTICGGTLSGVVAPNADILLVSQTGAVQLNQVVNAGTDPAVQPTVRLQAATGIAQAATGIITAAALGARTAGGDIVLDQANTMPLVAALDTGANGSISLRTTTAMTVGAVIADGAFFAEVDGITTTGATATVRLQAVGGIGQLVAGGREVGRISTSILGARNTGTGDILLGQANQVGTFAALNTAANGRVTLNTGTPLLVGDVPAAGTFLLTGGIVTASGDVLLRTAGALQFNSAVAAGTGVVRLQAAGGIGQSASGTITAGRLGVRSTGGFIILNQANSAPVFAAEDTVSNSAIIFRTTGALTLDTVTADAPLFAAVTGVTIPGVGSGVRLQAANGITQSAAGVVLSGSLGLLNTAAGNIDLGSANDVTLFSARNAAAGGTINYRDLTDLTLDASTAPDGTAVVGVTTNGGAVTLTVGTDFALATPIATAGGNATVTAGRNFTAGNPRPTTPELSVVPPTLVDLGGPAGGFFQVNPGTTGPAVVVFNVEVKARRATFGVDNILDPANPLANTFSDSFSMRPSAFTPITVNGNLPVPPVFPGDVLRLFLDPNINDLQFLPDVTRQGSGSFVFTGTPPSRQTLNFTSIESLPQAALSAFAVQTGPRPTDFVILAQGQIAGVQASNQISLPLAPPNPFVVSPAFVNPAALVAAPRLAVADVDGDTVPDLIVGGGPGGGPIVTVVSGQFVFGNTANLSLNDAILAQFFAYEQTFQGGVNVAAADFTGDGKAEIVTGTGQGGGPLVKTFTVNTAQPFGQRVQPFPGPLGGFMAYDPNFRGGVNVAVGDVTGDGKPDIVTGAGVGGGPHVKVFDGATGGLALQFMAYDPAFRGGVFVDAADFDGDGKADILTGPGVGGGPDIRIFSGATTAILFEFNAFPSVPSASPFPGGNANVGGVGGVAFFVDDPDGRPNDVVVTTGRGQQALAAVFHPVDGRLPTILVNDPNFLDGAIPAIIANAQV